MVFIVLNQERHKLLHCIAIKRFQSVFLIENHPVSYKHASNCKIASVRIKGKNVHIFFVHFFNVLSVLDNTMNGLKCFLVLLCLFKLQVICSLHHFILQLVFNLLCIPFEETCNVICHGFIHRRVNLIDTGAKTLPHMVVQTEPVSHMCASAEWIN